MPPMEEHKLVRRCGGGGINVVNDPVGNVGGVGSSGFPFNRVNRLNETALNALNSAALRALNLQNKDAISGIYNGGGDGCDDGGHNNLGVGAIVGCIAAGVGGIAAIILLIYCLRRCSKNKGGEGSGSGFGRLWEKARGMTGGGRGDEEKGMDHETGTQMAEEDPPRYGRRGH